MTRSELEEYLIEVMKMGGGALGGAADELTFGGASRLAPETFKKLEEEVPGSMLAGRVGSAFVPFGGVVGGLRGAGKLAGLAGAGGGSKLAKLISSLASKSGGADLASKAAIGAAGGAVEAGGQSALRNLIGGEDNDVKSSGGIGAGIGGALGALSPIARGTAKKLYRDPRIFSPTGGPRAQQINEELLDMGRWGGEDYFRKMAEKDKAKYSDLLGPKRLAIESEALPTEMALSPFMERMVEKSNVGSDDLAQFGKKLSAARQTLGEVPTYGEMAKYRESLNKELSDLAPMKRSAAITGQGQEAGNVLAADKALGALKSSIDKTEQAKIIERFGDVGAKDIETANKAYGRGREVLRNLDKIRGEANPIYVPATATGVGILGSMAAGGNMLPAAIGIGAGGLYQAGKSLPGRTGAAVALNKLSKNPERSASSVQRLVGALSSKEKKASGEDSLSIEFDNILKEPKREKNPRIKQRYKPEEDDPLLKEFDDLLR